MKMIMIRYDGIDDKQKSETKKGKNACETFGACFCAPPPLVFGTNSRMDGKF